MNSPIPTPLRAAAGLAAATIDEARRLPSRLVSLPVMAVSTALQASLKVQQRYAELVVRGDALLDQLRPEPATAPSWARFDDEPSGDGAEPEPPIAGYDEFSVPQLRARVRRLSAEQLEALIAYEQRHQNRAPYLTLLTNRLDALRR